MVRAFVTAALFLICGTPSAAEPPPSLAATHIGPVRMGMSPADVEALDLPIVRDQIFTEGDPYPLFRVEMGSSQIIEASFWNGRVYHLQTASREMATERGARVGMSLAELRDIYPEGRVYIGEADGWYFHYHIAQGALFVFDVSGLPETCFEYRGACPDLSDRRANAFVAIQNVP